MTGRRTSGELSERNQQQCTAPWILEWRAGRIAVWIGQYVRGVRIGFCAAANIEP
jgi:hypothetical protein